jgi:hypothetical protein
VSLFEGLGKFVQSTFAHSTSRKRESRRSKPYLASVKRRAATIRWGAPSLQGIYLVNRRGCSVANLKRMNEYSRGRKTVSGDKSALHTMNRFEKFLIFVSVETWGL